MRIHIIQHLTCGSLGNIAAWLSKRNDVVSVTCLETESVAAFPAVDELDFLIVLGGSMDLTRASAEIDYPTLATEQAYIKVAIQQGCRVLGICLGGQLVAQQLGVTVTCNEFKEVGWFDILSTVPASVPLNLGWRNKAFHWHKNTFSLPEGAVALAHSEACPLQAFLWGNKVLALQCHLEVTRADVEAMLAMPSGNPQASLAENRGFYVHTAAKINSATEADYAHLEQLMAKILDYLAEQTA
ncbi:MAG: type 1 glutamine amidotransferase [Neisseriaceae bacterium]|nr:type 1 glutamine amidotransferase [Neisseriaceae bacterium]